MSLNKVQLIGHLGADPEIRYTADESAVTTLSIATSRTWRDKKTNEKKEATEWHRVILWNRLAEIAGEYLKKGSHVYIEGALRTRKYEDKSNIERYVTEIVAGNLQMLGGKKEGQTTDGQNNIPPVADPSDYIPDMEMEDDIPF